MTQDELDALPDVTPQILREERVINGQKVFVPVLQGSARVLWQRDDDPLFIICARTGARYTVGWDGERRVKRVIAR